MSYSFSRSVFNEEQIKIIETAVKNKIDQDVFNILVSVNPKGQPSFSAECMHDITLAIFNGLSTDQIKIMSRLKSSGYPVFDHFQMKEIYYGFYNGLSKDKVNIYAKTIKNRPRFDSGAMYNIRTFIERADNPHIQQIKDCVDEGLNYNQISHLMDVDIPVNHIRLYRQMYKMNTYPSIISNSILNKQTFEEIKDVKLCCEYAKSLNVETNNYELILAANSKPLNFNGCVKIVLNTACDQCQITDPDCKEILLRCMLYKMPPEQINFITRVAISNIAEDVKATAIAFLNGISVQQYEDAIPRGDKCEEDEFLNRLSGNNPGFKNEYYDTNYFDDIEI